MTDAYRLRASDLIGISYFAYLAAAAIVVRLPIGRRVRVWALAVLMIGAELVVATHPSFMNGWLRVAMPAAAILVGYFATGYFYVAPSPRLEAWLAAWDDRLIDRKAFARLSPTVRVYLDLVYDSCVLLIPAGFGVLVYTGGWAMVERFWILVMMSEFLAFCTLPWLQARPPWAVADQQANDQTAVRHFSLLLVKHASIRANTLPSGHASASLAVALALVPTAPWIAFVFGLLAISIAIGSVVGDFHYTVDAIAGLLLALAVWGCATALGV